jgi:hypothetical protein
VLFANPLRFLTLPAVSFFTNPNLVPESIGVLGWLNIVLPRWLYGVWAVAIGLAALGDMKRIRAEPPAPRRWAELVLLVLAALAAVWAIYLSQYLAWTNVGMARIEGPTGRYLLPVVPLLALALPRIGLPGGARIACALRWAPMLALAIGLYALPRVLLGFFYLP